MYDFKSLTKKETRKQFMLYNNVQMAKEMEAAERHRAATRRLLEEAAQRANDARKLVLVKTRHLKLEERIKLLSTSGASRSAPLFSCGESILQCLPATVADVWQFCMASNWLRDKIPNFAQVSAPLQKIHLAWRCGPAQA